MKYYLFLDESGDHGLKNIDQDFPIFLFCGVLISEDNYALIRNEIYEIKEYDRQTTWVCGYANEMAAYIPSRRVWEEGGYEGGSHLDEYGRPAWRWAGDVEDRIGETVQKVVALLE